MKNAYQKCLYIFHLFFVGLVLPHWSPVLAPVPLPWPRPLPGYRVPVGWLDVIIQALAVWQIYVYIYIYIQRSNLLWFLFVDWSCINWKLKLGWYVTLKDRRIAAASWNESINANLQAMDFCLIGTSSESSWAVGLMYFSTTAATGVCGKWCF